MHFNFLLARRIKLEETKEIMNIDAKIDIMFECKNHNYNW